MPAHLCLIPRRTLRDLLQARGLTVLADRLSVHTFTLRYWLAGLGERGGWAGRTIAWVAARIPPDLMLTASLADERVMLARATHQLETHTPAYRRATAV